MAPERVAVAVGSNSPNSPESPDQGDLIAMFHRLNNQLGVVLANAELLESRLATETEKARATLVVSGALEAIATVRDLRRRMSHP